MASQQMEISVVGLLYRANPAKLHELASEAPLKCQLEREPDNDHDENAIKVVISEKPHKGYHIGYVNRQLASELAPIMDDQGDKWPWTDAWLAEIDDEHGTALLLVRKRPKAKSK